MTVPFERRAARVLLVDSADRVLLLHGSDPSEPERGAFRITPGGGLELGQFPAQAAARELTEEAGLRVDAAALGPVLHERVTTFRSGGGDYRQSEQYFLLEVDAHEVDTSAGDAVVDPGVTGHRWWAAAAAALDCRGGLPVRTVRRPRAARLPRQRIRESAAAGSPVRERLVGAEAGAAAQRLSARRRS